MFGTPEGLRIWQPEMTAFLKKIGLPSDHKAAFAKYRGAPALYPLDVAAPVAVEASNAPTN
jgi:hypothetical protein